MTAASACCTAESKPNSRSFITPSIVVPPGEQTRFISATGCSSEFMHISPLPTTVAAASSSDRLREKPARTPASLRASMYMRTKAPDEPPMAEKTSNLSSSMR